MQSGKLSTGECRKESVPMPRDEAALPGGVRMADLLSVSVLAAAYPREVVSEVLRETGRESRRERSLPATMMVYYVMALAIYMQVSYEEILRVVLDAYNWFGGGERLLIPAKSSISEARERLGSEPVEKLADRMVRPIATEQTRGAFFRGWRTVSLDGSVLDIGDTAENAKTFGRPGVSRGPGSAFPQVRFCALLECGTHVLFGARPGPSSTGETTLAREVVAHLKAGMLCLADRQFFGFQLWTQAAATGADLLWRVKANLLLPVERRLPDGSYVSHIYPSTKDRRNQRNGLQVRVIEYRLRGEGASEEMLYRLMTTILEPERAGALELAALYSERWEIENTLDEFKTHLRGRGIVLRSKTPEGVYQEFWGFVLAHNAIRKIMHDAALRADVDPDRLSFTHAVHTVRRKLPLFLVVPPSAVERPIPADAR
jgi:hypothetical protein